MGRGWIFVISVQAVILCLSAALPRRAEAGDAQKKKDFLQLVAAYNTKSKKHAYAFKQDCIRQIGEMRYPPSVPFLDKVLREEKDPGLLVDAIQALGKVGTLKAVQAAFKRTMAHRSSKHLLDYLPGSMLRVQDEGSAGWIVKKILPNRKPGVRLNAVMSLGAMKCKAGTDGLLPLLKDRDPAVAYESALSLGNIGDPKALPPLLELCSSKDWRMRSAGAWALGAYEDGDAFLALMCLLEDRSWQVRERAVISLRRHGKKESQENLIESLKDSTLRVATEIRENLFKLGEASAGGKPRRMPSYHGFPVQSDRVFFILDATVSMANAGRLKEARKVLIETLRVLPPRTMFGVAAFGNMPAFFMGKLVWATPGNVATAVNWLCQQVPFGNGNGFYTLKRTLETVTGLDTVFFLADGMMGGGKVAEPEDMLWELRRINRFSRIRIHTIAYLLGDPIRFEDKEDRGAVKNFLKRLAQENHGRGVSCE